MVLHFPIGSLIAVRRFFLARFMPPSQSRISFLPVSEKNVEVFKVINLHCRKLISCGVAQVDGAAAYASRMRAFCILYAQFRFDTVKNSTQI